MTRERKRVQTESQALVRDIVRPTAATILSGLLIEGARWHGMQWDAVNTVTVVLSALGVILTAMAIILALAAFWGYAGLKEAAERKAEETATRIATETAQRIARQVAEAIAARSVTAMETSESGGSPEEYEYGRAAADQ